MKDEVTLGQQITESIKNFWFRRRSDSLFPENSTSSHSQRTTLQPGAVSPISRGFGDSNPCFWQVAVAQYNEEPRAAFHFNQHRDRNGALGAIKGLSYTGGNTKTGLGGGLDTWDDPSGPGQNLEAEENIPLSGLKPFLWWECCARSCFKFENGLNLIFGSRFFNHLVLYPCPGFSPGFFLIIL